jgi:lysophospholipase
VGTREKIVEPDKIDARMRSWPKGRLVTVDGAEHEVLMETPARRQRAVDAIIDLFDSTA